MLFYLCYFTRNIVFFINIFFIFYFFFKVALYSFFFEIKNGCTGFIFGPKLGTYILLIMVSKLHSLKIQKIFCVYTLYVLSLWRQERSLSFCYFHRRSSCCRNIIIILSFLDRVAPPLRSHIKGKIQHLRSRKKRKRNIFFCK